MYSELFTFDRQTFGSKAGQGLEWFLEVRLREKHDQHSLAGPKDRNGVPASQGNVGAQSQVCSEERCPRDFTPRFGGSASCRLNRDDHGVWPGAR